MAITWLSPLTCTGAGQSVLVPSPSWPKPFQPQVHTVPSAFSAAVKRSPPDTASTLLNVGTCTGTFTPVVEVIPFPISPKPFSPHAQTVPADVSATACRQPAETCTT